MSRSWVQRSMPVPKHCNKPHAAQCTRVRAMCSSSGSIGAPCSTSMSMSASKYMHLMLLSVTSCRPHTRWRVLGLWDWRPWATASSSRPLQCWQATVKMSRTAVKMSVVSGPSKYPILSVLITLVTLDISTNHIVFAVKLSRKRSRHPPRKQLHSTTLRMTTSGTNTRALECWS